MKKEIVLASTSPYRRALLERLGLRFRADKPKFDEESAKAGNRSPLELAQFLAREKARSIAAPGLVVIGSDQLVSFEGEILGKPGTAEKAIAQLTRMQGKKHELITAVAVFADDKCVEFFDRTQITLRKLSTQEIVDYVAKDQPLDCAGAYKFEKAGIGLIEKLECADPTAIEGLPLIQLSTQLRQLGCW